MLYWSVDSFGISVISKCLFLLNWFSVLVLFKRTRKICLLALKCRTSVICFFGERKLLHSQSSNTQQQLESNSLPKKLVSKLFNLFPLKSSHLKTGLTPGEKEDKTVTIIYFHLISNNDAWFVICRFFSYTEV